jgi:hypothetical protein
MTAQLGGQTRVAVLRDRVHVARGSTVPFDIGPESLHLFNPATGQRIARAIPAPDSILFTT